MHSGLARQTINHFRRGHGFRINPVHMGKRAPTLVMINVDQKFVLESVKTGALDAVTLENNRSFVVAIDVLRLDNFASERKRLVDTRHTVAQNHVSLLCPSRAGSGGRPAPNRSRPRPAWRAR